MNNNILITSISSKIPLIETVIKAKNSFDKSIKVFGIDITDKILGKYYVDEFFILEKIKDLRFEFILEFCLINKIRYIIPTRDEDLVYYSSFIQIFIKNNIYLFSPDKNIVNLCYDKYLFVQNNKIDFNIKTSLNIEDLKEVEFFVVKTRFGSASKDIGIRISFEKAKRLAKTIKYPIFQEYIEGEEYSIDSYITKTNNFVGMIIRKREIVSDGESIDTYAIEDKDLEHLIKDFLLKNEILGHSITQVIKKNNKYYLVECNTRFGGASTLSYKMGLKSFYWFLCEANGKRFKFTKNKKNFRQIRIKKDIYFES